MTKKILSESQIRGLIKECIKSAMKQIRPITEANDYGWEVDNNEAQEAYQFACDKIGQETINQEIVDSLGTEQLAECLAFIFRNYDFREWDEYKAEKYSYEPDDEDEY